MEVKDVNEDKQQITIDTPMRPEFERGAGTGQWHGGPIAAEIDTVGDYAAALVLGRTLPTVIFRVRGAADRTERKTGKGLPLMLGA
jgi:hypothetical protein